MSIQPTKNQRELLRALIAYQEEQHSLYPFYYRINPKGFGAITDLQRFEFNPGDFETLVDYGLLRQIDQGRYRITRKGYEAMGVGLTNAQKETLRKLRACKEEKGVYPFVLRVNASGNYIELRIDGLEFAPNDINRLIDFDLLTRNGAEYRITTEGYQALENNFQLLPSVSEQLESRRRLLNQHQSNLLKLKENAAIYAAGEVPLHLTNQIEAEEKAIEEQEVAIAELESKKGND